MERSYEDIIHLPHHESAVHPRMPMADRAAQFSPFAALTGHAEAIRETARLTQDERELDEDMEGALDRRLQILRAHLEERPQVSVRCFVPDARKAGGSYVTREGRVKRIDGIRKEIVLEDGTAIPAVRICAIEGDLFGQNS